MSVLLPIAAIAAAVVVFGLVSLRSGAACGGCAGGCRRGREECAPPNDAEVFGCWPSQLIAEDPLELTVRKEKFHV